MDGQLTAGFDAPVDWVEGWDYMVKTNDLINANTGVLLPKGEAGFRGAAMYPQKYRVTVDGCRSQSLASGRRLDGRQAMSPATAWMTHGCFQLDSSQYYKWPITAGREGCHDITDAVAGDIACRP
jgi:alpha-1,3-glucan synthase